MTVETDLIDTLADRIEARFDPATFSVAAGALNPAPDLGAALSLSIVSDDQRQPLRAYMLQVRTRGSIDARSVNDVAETIADTLHGMRAVPAGQSIIAMVHRTSSVGLGRDDQRRWQRSDNFLIEVSILATQWISDE